VSKIQEVTSVRFLAGVVEYDMVENNIIFLPGYL